MTGWEIMAEIPHRILNNNLIHALLWMIRYKRYYDLARWSIAFTFALYILYLVIKHWRDCPDDLS